MNLYKRVLSLSIVTVILMNLLISSVFAESRWITVIETKRSQFLLDTMTYSSELKTYSDYDVYTAKGWYKLEIIEPSEKDVFKYLLRRFELKITYRNKSANLEARTLEDFAYDWDNKEIYHNKTAYSDWEALAPGSGEEELMSAIFGWDFQQRRQNMEKKKAGK